MIIEEATIDLGFSGEKAAKGIKDTKKSIADLNQAAAGYGRTVSNTLGEISKVASEISKVGAGLGLVVGATDYIRQVAIATRATDYLSKSVGMGADEITANRLANERLGISMESTNAILSERARIAQQLKAGGDAVSILGADFSRYDGSPVVMRDGSNDDKTAEYRKVYQNRIKTGMDNLGETREKAEANASNLSITGWQELLPILRMTNDEYRKLVELQKERSGITAENTAESQRLAAAWTSLDQSVTLAANQTARNFTPITADALEGIGAFTDEMLSESTRIYQGLTHPISNWGGFVDALTPKLNSWIKIGDKQGKQEKEQKKALEVNNAEIVKTVELVKDLDRSNLSGLETIFEKLKRMFLDMNPIKLLADGINNALPENMRIENGSLIAKALAWGGNQEAIDTVKTNASNAEQKENMRMTYDAYKKQGLSHNQAATMTSEVGRENDFNSQFMFGTHADKAGGQNIGMISMQGDRNPALREYMKNKGLMNGGVMERSQAAIDAQAAFQVAEMKSGKYPKAERFLSDPNIGRDEASELMGTGYVKWAKHQTRLRNGESFNPTPHLAKEYGYYDAVNKMQLQPPQIDTKALANPQTNNTSTATNNNYVTINLPTTDPTQAGNVIESQLKNVSKNAPYRSGMNPS